MIKYTDGHGNILSGNQLRKEIWKWYKFLKANRLLYPMLKDEYIRWMGLEKMKED